MTAGKRGDTRRRTDDDSDGCPKRSNKFVYEGEVGKHLWYVRHAAPMEFKRVWHPNHR